MPKKIHKNSETEKLVVILTHLGGIFLWIFPALIVYLVSEGGVKSHVKNALNWQISLFIYFCSSFLLCLLLIGFVFIWILPILNTIFCIIAAIKASQDKEFVYPMSIRFVKG